MRLGVREMMVWVENRHSFRGIYLTSKIFAMFTHILPTCLLPEIILNTQNFFAMIIIANLSYCDLIWNHALPPSHVTYS